MNKILLLEDNDYMREHIANLISTSKYLERSGYEVVGFQRIDQAKEYFNYHKNEIGCIVADLNMADEWLEEYRNESFGGILSGWVWLHRFVFPIKPNMPTVIFSGFLDELKNNSPPAQLNKKNIAYVAKGAGEDEGFIGLLNAIEKVTQR